LLVSIVRSYVMVPFGAVENRSTARALAGLVSPLVVNGSAMGAVPGQARQRRLGPMLVSLR